MNGGIVGSLVGALVVGEELTGAFVGAYNIN